MCRQQKEAENREEGKFGTEEKPKEKNEKAKAKKKNAPIDAYATLDNRKHLLNYIKVLTNSVSASFFFF